MRCPILLFALLLSCSAVLAGPEPEVNPYGNFYRDDQGLVTVEMATLAGKNKNGLHDVILVMRGFLAHEAEIDGVAILYRAERASSGADYRTTVGGKEFTRLVERNPGGSSPCWQVCLGGKTVDVRESEAESREVRPLHLATALGQKKTKAEPLPVNPYGMFYTTTPDGMEVEMAQVSETNANGLKDILLLISGKGAFAEGIDRKTIRYQAVRASSGVDYQYTKDGKTGTRMSVRESFRGGTGARLYLGGKEYVMAVDPGRSRGVRPLHLWTALSERK